MKKYDDGYDGMELEGSGIFYKRKDNWVSTMKDCSVGFYFIIILDYYL